MKAKRIIPCLDVQNGVTVKGINFQQIQEVGSAIDLAKRYVAEGADELVFLDITATNEKRKTLGSLVNDIAKNINIPFTVGGGIKSLDDVAYLMDCGADKISINTAAYNSPTLIDEIADKYGSQCIVLAIDAFLNEKKWQVALNGGRIKTDTLVLDWAIESQSRGAGEILLTSMAQDGTKEGFALEITQEVHAALDIPVIASGGAGKMKDFADLFISDSADAGLAASIFHYNEVKISDLKVFLKELNINVRYES